MLFIYLAVQSLHWGMKDLVPGPGIETRPPTLGVWSLSHWSTREVLNSNFIFDTAKVLIYVISDAIKDCMLLNFACSLLLTLEQLRVGSQTLMLSQKSM